jgi:glycosyltransferase involved in cell wall biosynthesis
VAFRIFVISGSAMFTDIRPHGDGLVAHGFVRQLALNGNELHVAAGRVDLREELPGNVHMHELGADNPHRLAFMWRVRRLYARLARIRTFDLVHQLTPVEVGVSLALGRGGPPLVLGPYVPDWAPTGLGADAEVSGAALRMKRILRAAQQARAASVLISTPAAADKVQLRGRRAGRVHELPLGVDERFWRPSGSPPRDGEVLYLASLEVRKGMHVMLDAFEQLAPRMPSARLLVGGGGAELERVRARIAASPALAGVELLGPVDRERARELMQGCAVYCLPSYGDPAPLAAVEAMACGRPVVATDAGGLGYLVPEEGGARVPPGNAGALAGALGRILGDPALARSMGEHNRRLVEERFAWPRVVARLEDLYGTATSDRSPGRS